MTTAVFTLRAPCSHREDVRKSRFVAHAAPVESAAGAMAFFAAHADPTATHNCWAYRIGGQYRFNDDGEPGGTAGRPILQAIEGQSCDRVAVLVVRWFGGILLGAGGLMRAYGGCAANCLRLGELVPVIDKAGGTFHCTFAELPIVKARLRDFDAGVVGESFDETGALLSLEVPRVRAADLARMLSDLSRGRASLELGGGPGSKA